MVASFISNCEISFPLDANLAVRGKKSLMYINFFQKNKCSDSIFNVDSPLDLVKGPLVATSR